MCDLISHEEDAIQIISRFGLEMGVGEQTIEQVCEAYHVHTPTFLAIVNYKVFHKRVIPDDIDIPTLQRYLSNAHSYFLEFRLPRLRRALIEALIPADPTTKIPGLILRCYDEFVEEIRTHIAHENEGLFDEHEHDDQRITDKLTEIKNLIIKYYPGVHLQSPIPNHQPPITNHLSADKCNVRLMAYGAGFCRPLCDRGRYLPSGIDPREAPHSSSLSIA